MVLLAVKTLHLGGLAASQFVLLFFFLHVLDRGFGLLAAYGLVVSLMLLASTPLWLRAARHIGKRNAYMIASIASALVGLTWYWSGPEEPVAWLFARAVAGGVISSGMLLMGQAMLPDAIHHDTVRSGGLRREGVFAGFYTTAEKLASAVGGLATGAWLQTQGYVPSLTGGAEQPASAIAAIYDVMAAIHSALIFASALVLTAYRLDASLRQEARA
jgi:GPH family glycoside/pentoside/hexuronide:cation symporter